MAEGQGKKRENKETGLNHNQELFCNLYACDEEFFANGTRSYMKAYGLEPKQYKTAMVNAARLLSNAKILARINELLELRGLNDQFVDKQLEFLITQNADLKSKTAAIREYNKLKGRITEKLDHTTKGKEIALLSQAQAVNILDALNDPNSTAS